MMAESNSFEHEQCSDITVQSPNTTNEEAATRSVRHTYVTDDSTVVGSPHFESVYERPPLASLISKGGTDDDVDVSIRDDSDNEDHGAVTGSSQESSTPHRLAEKYSKLNSCDSEDHIPAADTIKISRELIKMQEAKETLEAKFDSHLELSKAQESKQKALEDEIRARKSKQKALEDVIQQLNKELQSCRVLPGSEERIRSLEQELEEKNSSNRQMNASMQLLQYGVQNKCGVCNENNKIISSHPYSKAVVKTVLGANYSGIYNLQQKRWLFPDDCQWDHLCAECDKSTCTVESKFTNYLKSALKDSKSVPSDQNLLSLCYTDLFHVYTFRALLRNVDTHHYIPPIPGCETNQECTCTCSELLHPLNNFLKRAHHLSRPYIWKDRSIDPEKELTPSKAGMLYSVCHTSIKDHWIEFPLICKIHFESEPASHYYIIFAQIPPFYWAFPLPLDDGQDVPYRISDDVKTSDVLVKAHFPEAMRIADVLSKYFDQIIAEINKVLEQKRKSLLIGPLKKWHHHLEEQKRKIEKKGKAIEDEHKDCVKTRKDLNKKMNENDQKLNCNEESLKNIHEEIERHQEREAETGSTQIKKEIASQILKFTTTRGQLMDKSEDLRKKQEEYNADLKKNDSKEKALYNKKVGLYNDGLGTEFKPKLLIGYFRDKCCCLEVTLPS